MLVCLLLMFLVRFYKSGPTNLVVSILNVLFFADSCVQVFALLFHICCLLAPSKENLCVCRVLIFLILVHISTSVSDVQKLEIVALVSISIQVNLGSHLYCFNFCFTPPQLLVLFCLILPGMFLLQTQILFSL